MLEAASWRLAAEAVRRYPLSLRVLETRPGGGQYDCLTIVDIDPLSPLDHIDLNRQGSIHAFGRDGTHGTWSGAWAEALAVSDPRLLGDRLCRLAGLPPIQHMPASTHSSITYRVVAAFLSHAIFGRQQWECRNGFFDGSGYEGAPREEYFAAFPDLRDRFRQPVPEDFPVEPAQRFWFLAVDAQPRLAIEPLAGLAWDLDGRQHQLFELYRGSNRRIWPIVWQIAGDLLS